MATRNRGRDTGTGTIDTDNIRQPRPNTICMGSGTGSRGKKAEYVEVPSTSRPLNTVVEKSTLRTQRKYDWQTGEFRTEHASVLENAQMCINHAKIKTVTSNRRDCKQQDEEYQYGSSPVPMSTSLSGTRRRRKY